MIKERFLFLGGHRKCGTTMLLNLFDGHEECCVYPTDIAVLYGYFPVYCQGGYTTEQRLNRLDMVISGALDRLGQKRDLVKELPFGAIRENFFDNIDRQKLDQIDVIIRQLIASYRWAFGLSVEKAPVVVIKETSLEIYARLLAVKFPGAKFIQLVRDPRDNYGALRAGVDKRYKFFGEDERHTLASLLQRVSLGMDLIAPNIQLLGEYRFKCIKFEELAANPEAVLKQVCDFCQIKYSTKMSYPTVLGKGTAGNNYDGKRLYEISTENVGRWWHRISQKQAQIIEFHLGRVMELYGYELSFTLEERVQAATEFYMWSNYNYFYKDSFEVF